MHIENMSYLHQDGRCILTFFVASFWGVLETTRAPPSWRIGFGVAGKPSSPKSEATTNTEAKQPQIMGHLPSRESCRLIFGWLGMSHFFVGRTAEPTNPAQET